MKVIKKNMKFNEDQEATTKELTHLKTMVAKQVGLQKKLEAFFSLCYEITDELNELRLRKLPDYAKSIGISSITLDSGEKFEIKGELTAKIRDEEKCMSYLKKNGHESIVKNEISIKFDATENKEFESVVSYLKNTKTSFDQKKSIHAATLKKFAKERIVALDPDFDQKAFGVFQIQQAVINGKKPIKYKK